MHSSSSPGTSSNGRDGDPTDGFEFTYNRRFGNGEKWTGVWKRRSIIEVSINDSHALSGTGTLIVDAFQLRKSSGRGFRRSSPAPYSHGPFLTSDTGNTALMQRPRLPLSTFATSIAGTRHLMRCLRLAFGALMPRFLSATKSRWLEWRTGPGGYYKRLSIPRNCDFDENIGVGPGSRSNAASSSGLMYW